jgi:hypothetical protein
MVISYKRNELIKEIVILINNEVKEYKKTLDKRGCKNSIDYKFFITIFLDKLETNLTWSRLGDIYKVSKSHIHNTYCKWSNYGIFKNVFNKFLKKYSLFIDNNEAYIDTTTIFNKYGYVNTVGMNTYESKKHKSNKLSIVASKNGIPLGININTGNIHDIKMLLDTLPIKTHFKFLYADKSYISKKLKERLLLTKNITLINPCKKNQKEHNSKEDIIGLKNRMRIEHINNKLKQNKSLNTRYIKELIHFESLIYFGCLKLGLQVIINNFYNF